MFDFANKIGIALPLGTYHCWIQSGKILHVIAGQLLRPQVLDFVLLGLMQKINGWRLKEGGAQGGTEGPQKL